MFRSIFGTVLSAYYYHFVSPEVERKISWSYPWYHWWMQTYQHPYASIYFFAQPTACVSENVDSVRAIRTTQSTLWEWKIARKFLHILSFTGLYSIRGWHVSRSRCFTSLNWTDDKHIANLTPTLLITPILIIYFNKMIVFFLVDLLRSELGSEFGSNEIILIFWIQNSRNLTNNQILFPTQLELSTPRFNGFLIRFTFKFSETVNISKTARVSLWNCGFRFSCGLVDSGKAAFFV